MKRLLIALVLAALLVCVSAAPASAAGVAPLPTGEYGGFAEGLAADSHGVLYASLTQLGYANEDYTVLEPNIGEIWRVTPGGSTRLAASMPVTAYGMLTGVAVDRCDRVYVAVADFAPLYDEPAEIGSGVYRLCADGSLAKVVGLPDGTFPNGIAFHRGFLYITDSALGAVWRVRPACGVAEPVTPWLQDDLLTLDPEGFGIGANGLAFLGDCLYVSVSDFGRIVRVPVRADGSHGAVRVVCEAPELASADGIAFDLLGRLWITVNAGSTGGSPGGSPSGALYRLSPNGTLKQVADDPGWLNYPTMPVFGTTWRTCGTLYIENGDYWGIAAPDITAVSVGIPGLPLW